jgi:RNA polymerase-interacting CarD/CdnL/TRCF family regulator
MANSSTSPSPERATYRTVILLRRSEKAKLERLALKEKISSAEVIRRFIRHGDSLFKNKQEEEIIEAALKIISAAVSEANESMVRTIDKLDRVHLELKKRDIR